MFKRWQFIVGYFIFLPSGFILSRALKAVGELIFSFHISLNKSETSWGNDWILMTNLFFFFCLHGNITKGAEACPGHRCCRICLIKSPFTRNYEWRARSTAPAWFVSKHYHEMSFHDKPPLWVEWLSRY